MKESGHADFIEEICEPILDLVYRIYSDDQYPNSSKAKTLSFEIVDHFSNNLEKGKFLSIFNSVKSSIA